MRLSKVIAVLLVCCSPARLLPPLLSSVPTCEAIWSEPRCVKAQSQLIWLHRSHAVDDQRGKPCFRVLVGCSCILFEPTVALFAGWQVAKTTLKTAQPADSPPPRSQPSRAEWTGSPAMFKGPLPFSHDVSWHPTMTPEEHQV